MHLPDWYTPCAAQCSLPHPIYIDTVPWPALREKLTTQYESYDWHAFVVSFCQNLDVNWTEDARKTYVVGSKGNTTLSPAFVSHLRSLQHWTLKPPFAEQYPALAKLVNLGRDP